MPVKKKTKAAAKKKSLTTTPKRAAKGATKRTVKRAAEPFFEVRKSNIQGRGVFALWPIRKGQRLIEYAGERISEEAADARYDETKMRRHHTFLFTLDNKTVVDGAVNGNDSIYINHACDPNCEAVITGKRIYIYSLRSIQPGEELGYDYQYERTGENDEEMEKFYKCLCGSPLCRGSIMKPARSSKKAAKPVKRGKSAGNQRRKKRVR